MVMTMYDESASWDDEWSGEMNASVFDQNIPARRSDEDVPDREMI